MRSSSSKVLCFSWSQGPFVLHQKHSIPSMIRLYNFFSAVSLPCALAQKQFCTSRSKTYAILRIITNTVPWPSLKIIHFHSPLTKSGIYLETKQPWFVEDVHISLWSIWWNIHFLFNRLQIHQREKKFQSQLSLLLQAAIIIRICKCHRLK